MSVPQAALKPHVVSVQRGKDVPDSLFNAAAVQSEDAAFKAGSLFNKRITSTFWSSFDGKYGKTQIEVLVHLYDNGKCMAADMARALNVPKQHISKIVRAFESEGLVEI